MSRLFKLSETQSWLHEWGGLAENGSKRARGVIARAAIEQRANLEAVKRTGNGGWCNPEEYERCVVAIERVASEHMGAIK